MLVARRPDSNEIGEVDCDEYLCRRWYGVGVLGIGRAIVGPRATTIFSLGDMRAGSLEEPVVEATLA